MKIRNLLIHRNIDSLNVSDLDKHFIKLSSETLNFHNARTLARLMRTYQKTNLSSYYVCKMKHNERSKFQKVCDDQEKALNHLIHMKKNSRCSLKT